MTNSSFQAMPAEMKRRCSKFFIGILVLGLASQSMAEVYSVRPVGHVVKGSGVARLEILPEFRDALQGLSGFSHILLFYWFDRNDSPEKRTVLKVHPRGNKANPLTGVFATRSPFRPNLVGLSVCRIRSLHDGVITVDDIDALDGSPIIDLKPYIPTYDSVPGASVPEWMRRVNPRSNTR